MRGLFALALATSLAAPILAAPAHGQATASPRVVAEDRTETIRRLDVRLDGRIPEHDVQELAEALVAMESQLFARTTINFRLPTMKLGDEPWASVTITRDLRMKIPGLTLAEVERFTADAHADRRDVIGNWLMSPPAKPGRLTIFREDRRTFAEWHLRDGLTAREELRESRISGGVRFDFVGSEDNFRIYDKGDLEMRSKEKLIAVAERIRPAAPAPTSVAAAKPLPAPAAIAPAAAASGEPAVIPAVTVPRRNPAPTAVALVPSQQPLEAAAPAPVSEVRPVAAAKPVKAARPSKPTTVQPKGPSTTVGVANAQEKRRRELAVYNQTAI